MAIPTTLTTDAAAVETRGLRKHYRSETALDGVDLTVPEGAVYALVGPNGAGKSTLIRTLLDLTRPDEGTVSVFGMDAAREGPTVRAQIGYVAERHDWTPHWLKVGKLLDLHAAYHPTWDHEYAREMSRLFDLRLDRPLKKLSKGQGRRVQLLMALAHRPRLLLLDEPTDGLDPVMRDEVHGLLTDHLAATDTTVLLSTHHVHEVAGLVDHVGVLSRGRLVAQTPAGEMDARLRRYRVHAPDGWAGAPDLNGAVVRRRSEGPESMLVIWGDEDRVRAALEQSGASVREVSRLSLEEATVALITRTGPER